MSAFIEQLLSFAAEHDVCDCLCWRKDLKVYVNCNDVFWWATADGEEITAETLEAFKQAVIEAEFYGPTLYCCRRRKMRPQGAWYRDNTNQPYWPLFDACGPKRGVDLMAFGNPQAQPSEGEEAQA